MATSRHPTPNLAGFLLRILILGLWLLNTLRTAILTSSNLLSTCIIANFLSKHASKELLLLSQV